MFFFFFNSSRFQYVLAAATSIATKVNEESLTYLNQGQPYEIKMKKLGDLSNFRGKLLRVRIFRFFFFSDKFMLNDSFLFLDSERGEIVFSREATSIYGTGTNCRMEDVSAWGPYCRNRCTSILRHLRCPPGQQQPQCSRIRLGSDQRSWRLHQSQLHQYGIYAKEARRRKRCSLPHPGWNLLPWWRRRHSKTTARRRLSDQSVQGTPNFNGIVAAKSI